MPYYLCPACTLKRLESPCLYRCDTDELYELDEEGFASLRACASPQGADLPQGEFLEYCLAEGILSLQERDHLGEHIHPPINQSPTPSLRYLELQITRRCNLSCSHCYLGAAADVELSAHEVEAVLREFEAMQGIRVLISGGEPLLHRQFDDINNLLAGVALRRVLFTNGLLLSDARLRGLNVDEIQISIDGMRAGHEALRGSGTYDRALAGLKRAKAAGYEVSVSTMAHRANLQEFDAMQELFDSIGVRDWTVDVPCAEGAMKGHEGLMLTAQEAGRCMRYGHGEGLHGGGTGYACGLHLMAVTPEGTLAKCGFYAHHPLGHIRDGLAASWQRLAPVPLTELECRGCEVIESCRGGCRYRAELLGSPLGRDFPRCASYDKMIIS